MLAKQLQACREEAAWLRESSSAGLGNLCQSRHRLAVDLCRVRLWFKWLQVNRIHEPAHTWKGLEACTYGTYGCLHGLKYGQLKQHNFGEQSRPNLVPEQAFVYLVWAQIQLVWCTAFPLHVVTCMNYLCQRLSRQFQFGGISCRHLCVICLGKQK